MLSTNRHLFPYQSSSCFIHSSGARGGNEPRTKTKCAKRPKSLSRSFSPKGGTHSLSRRIEGATAKDVQARLADLDPRGLPSVAEAKEAQEQRQPARELPRQAERASPGRADHAAPEAFRGKAPGRVMDGAARAVEGVAGGVLRGVGKVLDGAASLFEGLLGGGPSPEQVQQAKDSAQAPPPAPEPEPPRGPDRVEAFLAEERQRFAEERRQALLRDYGRREVPPGAMRETG
jgi:hypothetical protein